MIIILKLLQVLENKRYENTSQAIIILKLSPVMPLVVLQYERCGNTSQA